jgi:hypothetical protein
LRASFSLAAGFLCGHHTGCFLSLTASGFIGLTTGLCFCEAPSLFRGEPLSFFFGATSSFFFGDSPRFLFGLVALGCFRAHLGFDFSPQAGFFLRAPKRFAFGLAASFLFDAPARDVFGKSLRFGDGLEVRVLASLNARDLFFDGPDSHLTATAQLLFLSPLTSFGFQVVTFLFSTLAGVFLFRLT